MLGRLAEIVENKRVEVQARKRSCSLTKLENKIAPGTGAFLKALQEPGLRLITEIKPKSPSAGVLRSELALPEVVASYDKFAAAISVLTDNKYFGGSLELLTQVSQYTEKPLLCKDFIIDEYQCFEARRAGAEAALLMVKIMDSDEQLCLLHKRILALKMVPVVEVQTLEEMRRALVLEPQVILINNRDLTTFEINLSTTQQLAPLVPRGIPIVSASGIESSDDIKSLLSCTTIFLIGSALMRSDNLDEKLSQLSSATGSVG